MGSDFPNSREWLLKSLRGQYLVVPDLQALLQHWPHEVNPALDRLEKDIDARLELLFPEADRLRKMRATHVAYFGASWWPYASFETLRIATYLSLWLFAWDDETDSKEFSSLVTDFEQAQSFRAETLGFIRKCLSEGSSDPVASVSSNTVITSFEPVGKSIVLSCSKEQTKLFLAELVFFLEMTDVEQKFQMREELPSVEEYKKFRMGSSAVGVCLAITEYCYGMEMPRSIMAEEDMSTVWKESNVIISTMNDILSVKKEIAQGQVDTLIPLLYLRHGSLQAAVDSAMETLQISIKSFEFSAQKLLLKYAHDNEVYEKLQNFIHGCKCACTANMMWSLHSGRYKLDSKSLREGIPILL